MPNIFKDVLIHKYREAKESNHRYQIGKIDSDGAGMGKRIFSCH